MADTFLKFACGECKRITYRRRLSQRKKGTERQKIETQKFCRFCRKHTVHRETK